MRRVTAFAGLVALSLLGGCAAGPAASQTPAAESPLRPAEVPVRVITEDYLPSGIIYLLAIENDGGLRADGVVLDDQFVAQSIRMMHGNMPVVVRVDMPEKTSFQKVMNAIDRLQKLLRENASPDLQTGIYLQVFRKVR